MFSAFESRYIVERECRQNEIEGAVTQHGQVIFMRQEIAAVRIARRRFAEHGLRHIDARDIESQFAKEARGAAGAAAKIQCAATGNMFSKKLGNVSKRQVICTWKIQVSVCAGSLRVFVNVFKGVAHRQTGHAKRRTSENRSAARNNPPKMSLLWRASQRGR